MSPRRLNGAWGCLLFLAAFLIFRKTFCSSLYPDDSGETATLAAVLGIGHPPGYPLHTLLSRLFSLLPLGDTALRINLFAAFLGALGAPLAYFCARAFVAPLPSLLAPLLFCLGPAYWHNAGVAKGSVYMLNNILSLGIFLTLLAKPGPARARLFFLLLGLALAHHYMSQLVLLPCYVLLLGPRAWRRAPWMLPGLSLYAYLFIRSAQHPALNWGAIAGWDGFVFFLSRAQYASSEVSRSLDTSLTLLKTALFYLFQEGRFMALPLAMLALWKPEKPARALALGLLGTLAGVGVYLNLQGERLSIMQPYLFPAYLCVSILAAAGLGRLKLKPAALGLGLVAALAPAARGFALQNKSNYFYAVDSARNTLQSLPKNAVLFAKGDALIFPLWYLQMVKHEREDVALVGVPVLPMPWVRGALHEKYPSLRQPYVPGPLGAESTAPLVQALLGLNQGRLPLYFSYNVLDPGVAAWRLLPEGPAYLAEPLSGRGSVSGAEARLQAAVTRGFETLLIDARTRKLLVNDLAIHANSLGTWLEEKNDLPGALRLYQRAASIDPSAAEFPFNAGNALHALGRKEEALASYRKALAADPLYENAWYNLAAAEFMRGRQDEGCQALQKLLEINPRNPSALAQKGRCQNIQ
jgi:tetratricopeptide (TPR) repeat protein